MNSIKVIDQQLAVQRYYCLYFLVLTHSFFRTSWLWHPPLHYNTPVSFREEEFCLRVFFFLKPGLSCSFPLQQKQQAAAKCSVNGSIHRARERGQLGFK